MSKDIEKLSKKDINRLTVLAKELRDYSQERHQNLVLKSLERIFRENRRDNNK